MGEEDYHQKLILKMFTTRLEKQQYEKQISQGDKINNKSVKQLNTFEIFTIQSNSVNNLSTIR